MIAATAQAPPPPALTGAIVRQAGEDVLARLSFSAPPVAGERVCITFRAGRACLHGAGARIAQRRRDAWVFVGRAQAQPDGNDVVIRASAAKLRVRLGASSRWTASAEAQAVHGTLRTHRFRLLPAKCLHRSD